MRHPISTRPLATHVPCLRCGYDVTALDDEGLCPECGFSIATTRRTLQIDDAPAGRFDRYLYRSVVVFAFVQAALVAASVPPVSLIRARGLVLLWPLVGFSCVLAASRQFLSPPPFSVRAAERSLFLVVAITIAAIIISIGL